MPKPESKSPRRKKNPAAETAKRIVSTRLSTPRRETNAGKLRAIVPVFGRVASLKNAVSVFLRENVARLFSPEEKRILLKDCVKFSDNRDLSAWETQALYQDVFGHYAESLERAWKRLGRRKMRTRLSDLVDETIRSTVFARGNFSGRVRDCLDDLEARKGAGFVGRLLAVAESRRGRILDAVKTHVYSTGTHRRNPDHDGCRLIRDKTNGKYRWFMEFRLGNATVGKTIVRLPVLFDPRRFKPEEIRNAIYGVKYAGGRLHFLRTVEREEPAFATEESKTVGLDVNTSRNLVVGSDGSTIPVDVERMKDLLERVKALGHPKSYTKKQKSVLKKLTRRNESCLKKDVAKYVSAAKEKGVTDLVLEDLAMQGDATKVRGKAIDAKQSRINRLLRLSALKGWFAVAGEKRGIRVHLTHPGFTSQTCPKCGHVAKDNRISQSRFVCAKCKHSADADLNAAINVERRLTVPGLRSGLHDQDGYGRTRPRFGRLSDHRVELLRLLKEVHEPSKKEDPSGGVLLTSRPRKRKSSAVSSPSEPARSSVL